MAGLFQQYFLSGVLLLLWSAAAQAGRYSESFDSGPNWFGGPMTEFSALYYTNALAASLDSIFSADWALRSNQAQSPPYAWKIATGEHWFRFACTSSVVQFSLALARDFGEYPDLVIRYSRNSGATWQTIYSGTDILNSRPEFVYTQFFSAVLNISPNPGYALYIDVHKFLGAPIYIDDFSLEFSNPVSNTAALVYPAPAQSCPVGTPFEFYSDSIAEGSARIGYGRSSFNSGWTWLNTGPTGLVFGCGATNSFWLTSGTWFYAARWSRDDTHQTNFAWNSAGQTGQTVLQAEYTLHVTNYAWSTVWDFSVPNQTYPARQPHQLPAGLYFSAGLSSNIPGNGVCEISGFPAERQEQLNAVFFSDRGERPGRGFFCAASRDNGGPRFLDLQFSPDAQTWHDWISHFELDQTGAWYMIGGQLQQLNDYSNWYVRLIAYDAQSGRLSLHETQFAALVPEPSLLAFIVVSVFFRRFFKLSTSINARVSP